MMRIGVVALLALFFASESALAQSSRIVGAVTAADGNVPIFAAEIEVRGPGVRRLGSTRDDGRYAVPVEPGTYTVFARRIGYAPDSAVNVVVGAGAAVTVNFKLRSSALQVQGVTVIGYGTQDVRNATSSVAAVTPDKFNVGRVVSPEQLITAKVPGVQVIDNNEPGGGISIRIRGGTSVNASNEPLFVIDGVPLNVGGGLSSGRNPLNFLNPNDIKEVTVLRDASASAIYGSRGANGVVLITTKSGSASEPAFLYTNSFSTSTIANRPDLLNAAQFRSLVTANAAPNVGTLGTANTDWLDLVTRTAGGAEHNFAVSGVRDDMRYRMSLGLLNQDGILAGTNTQRVSGSATYRDVLLDSRLELSANFKGTRNLDSYSPGGTIGNAVAMDPTQTPLIGSTYFQYTNPLGANNPLSDLALLYDEGTTFRSVGNIEAKWFFRQVDGLTATLRTGYDYATSTRTQFAPSGAQGEIDAGRTGRIDRNTPRQVNTLLELFSNYTRDISALDSRLDVTAGYTFEEQRGDYASFFAENLATDLLGPNGVPNAGQTRPSLSVEESRLISLFTRANWSLRDRYYATFSLRREGSSRFGPGNQWGTFPSFAAGWRIREEAWFPTSRSITDLKLRFSWGQNGNQSFGNYLYVPTYTPGGAQATYQFGNQFVSTLRPSAVDPNIQWERTTETNLGLDFGLFNNRVTGELNVYTKNTDDLIFSIPVPAGTTTGNFVTTNIGSMRNNGVELALNWVVREGGDDRWGYDANFAISSNRNEITAISASETDRILVGGIAGGVGSRIQVLQPGSPINSFYVFEHRKTADGRPVAGPTDLDRYVDQNGDNVINQDDLRAFRDPAPRLIIGHTSTASYKNWEFSATARAYLGNYVYNNVASNLGHLQGLTLANAPSNRHASVLETQFVNPQYFSDYYVEDASFLRLDNISVAYTFDRLLGARSVRVFGAMQNVFTITGYSGVDPLAGVAGIDNNLFPLSRTVTAGLSLAF